jgi:hypothetical protein
MLTEAARQRAVSFSFGPLALESSSKIAFEDETPLKFGRSNFLLAAIAGACAVLAGCGGTPMGNGGDNCTITAVLVPATAVSDHNNLPPGNQIQFSQRNNASGNCVVSEATCAPHWTTSDTVNTQIDQTGLATCVNATPTPATIHQTCPFDGVTPTPATLTCN